MLILGSRRGTRPEWRGMMAPGAGQVKQILLEYVAALTAPFPYPYSRPWVQIPKNNFRFPFG